MQDRITFNDGDRSASQVGQAAAVRSNVGDDSGPQEAEGVGQEADASQGGEGISAQELDTGLIGTLENPGEFDCLSKLRPGEPFFLLLGRDRLAPPLVQEWATANRKRALAEHDDGKIDDEKRDRELRKSTQAEAQGWAMKSFKAGDMAKKIAGQPTAKAYTGAELPEETKHRDALASARNRAAAAIQSARAELAGVLEAIEPLKDDPKLADLASIVTLEMGEMQLLAEQVVSWRPIGALQQSSS